MVLVLFFFVLFLTCEILEFSAGIFVHILDINECDNGENDCHLNGSCFNVPGSYYCQCNKGFAGSGKLCQGKTLTSYSSSF